MRRSSSLLLAFGVVAGLAGPPAAATTTPFDLRYRFSLDSGAVVKAVATGPDGDVFVVYTGDPLVHRYTYAGEVVSTIGAGAGSGAGQLSGPNGLAVDNSGDVFVSDNGNKRIVEFDGTGTFVRSWTATDAGVFGNPVGVAVGNGQVYVADAGAQALDVFSLTGSPLYHQSPLGGSVGGVAVDAATGTVYVTAGSYVDEYGPSGVALTRFGGAGSGNGQLSGATSVAAFNDLVSVRDAGNSRDEQFRSDGTFVRSFGDYRLTDLLGVGLAVDCTGNLYADYANSGTVRDWLAVLGDPSARIGTCPLPATRSLGDNATAIGGAAVDRAGDVYATEQSADRVVKFAPNGSVITRWGSSGSGAGQFASPAGIAVDAAGNVYVADAGNSRVEIFGSAGRFIRAFGSSGQSNGKFTQMSDIAADGAGHIAVGDLAAGNVGRVQIFNTSGVFQHAVTFAGTPYSFVTGLSVDSKGRFVVAWIDESFGPWHGHVVRLEPAGVLESDQVLPQALEGTSVPLGTAELPDGRLVTGMTNIDPNSLTGAEDLPVNGLMYLDANGNFLSRTGSDGSAPGEFEHLGQINVDCAGDLYVADGARIVQLGLGQAACRWRPSVVTGAATKTTRTSTVVGGSVNPSAQATTWWVQWGTSKRYGHTTAVKSLPSDNRPLSVSVTLAGLTRGTTYHYRLVAKNGSGTANGSDHSLRTAS